MSNNILQKNAKEVAKITGKNPGYLPAADVFNTLSKEQQGSLKEWFYEKYENEKGKEKEKNRTKIKIRDAKIRKLEIDKRKLKDKLKKAQEAQEAPDISFYLEACIKRQCDTNLVLKEIFANKDILSNSRMTDLMKYVQMTVTIIRNSMSTSNSKLLEGSHGKMEGKQ